MGSGDLDRAKIKARTLFAFGVWIAHGFVDATLRDGMADAAAAHQRGGAVGWTDLRAVRGNVPGALQPHGLGDRAGEDAAVRLHLGLWK
jgi:hypothetical protein